MRQIGTLQNQQLARRFTDFLTTLDIAAVAEQEQGTWSIWVRDEDQVDKSRSALDQFVADPNREMYMRAAAEAQRVREAAARKERELAKKKVEMREVWSQPLSKRAPLMTALLFVSGFVFVLSGFESSQDSAAVSTLAFFDPAHVTERAWNENPDAFVDIRQGEVWRLLTPVFLHGGFMHLIFNMYWLYNLGGVIEVRHGPGRLALLLVVSGISGNVAQMIIGGPSLLRGMSGVVYGLFGYLWIRMLLVPQERLIIRREVVVLLLGFLLLGFTGVLRPLVGSVANYAHLFGMFGGMAVAYIISWLPAKRGT